MNGGTRSSPAASWYCVNALSMTMRGHQSSFERGPNIPFRAWLFSVQSMYFCAFAFSLASSRRYASGTKPSRK